MKTIEVVAAVIKDGDQILATRRGYGEFINMWEFPGGKIENGETHEDALKREIMEELEISILVDKYLLTVEYDYPDFHLSMHCYLCTSFEGTIHCNDHNAIKWVDGSNIDDLEWLSADIPVVEKAKELLE